MDLMSVTFDHVLILFYLLMIIVSVISYGSGVCELTNSY